MAFDRQVTCITPDASDADQRIDAIGGLGFKILIDQAIAGIENGTWSFWTRVNGQRADIKVAQRPNGRKYLKTTADEYEPNNLLALPRCP
jgi:hypothetical protein